jgi:hypothetical protein
MVKKSVVIVVLLIICFSIQAQNQFGTWTSFTIDKKVDKWTLEAETELRTISGVQLINRWDMGLGAEYKIIKPLKVGLEYQFMNVLDEKYNNYQFRHRFTGSISGTKKFGNFLVGLSEGLQVTTKNDSKRIRDDGTIDTYKVNPASMWKNSAEAEYNIPKCKLTPEFEFKTYYSLNDPDGNAFDKLRYTLSLKYKLNKHNSINVFGVYNKELGTDEADYSGKYILGVKYSYHLK